MDSTTGYDRERNGRFIRQVLIVFALGALAVTIWMLTDILLLVFGSVLVAVILRAISDPISRHTGLPDGLALVLTILSIVGTIAACVLFFGPEVAQQVRGLLKGLPAAFENLTATLQLGSFADLLKSSGATSSLGSMLSRVFAWSSSVLGAAASVALVLVGGIYLAADPDLYRQGLIKLFPPAVQPNIEATLDDSGKALRAWLGGQLIAMTLVGSLTAVGLWWVGVPNAFALGLIVGLADFVPFIGPIFAAIPVLLIASAQGWETVLGAVAVLFVMQQVENNLIVPLVSGRAVSMAPVVGVFAVVALAVIFGPLGLLLGFPLAIVIDVAVRRLYVRDGLDEPVEIMGEPAERSSEVREPN